ncbi:DUF916 and DUF3324 domain-containing protein [Xylocopilactobacillus apicola]|uniref:Cell surface protein n=1 Tax=Xylocopilactobacillus apicola TaxID=2932184 RepID=A0AAU9DHR6_9LACO|nr:DUF916 and DUF3324 domain-containing protein [Xylocopilactobacillus apicola]BDR59580.1 cell surface protein [Xylocopilactobacillus apicola]
MKKKFRIIFAINIFFLAIFLNEKFVRADGVPFDVSVITPENQVDGINGWFNVKVKPGDRQIFQLNVNNRSNQKIRVEVVPTDATTANSGERAYIPFSGQVDPSLKYRFPKLTQKSKKITIPAQDSKLVTFTVDVPKGAKNQMIMGGFFVNQIGNNSEKQTISKTQKQKVQLRSYYNYTIAAVMKIGKMPAPNLKLSSIAPGFQGGYAAFGARIQNEKANYISDVTVDAQVTKKGSQKIVTSRKQSGVAMAPNSSFTYYMQLGKFSVSPGVYHLNLDARGAGKKWHFSKDFEVTRSQAKDLNNNNLLLPKSYLWLYILIAVVVLVLFVGVVIFFYFRGQNKARQRLETNLRTMNKSSGTSEDSNTDNNRKRGAPRRRRK